jgi:hypothetical protein
MKKYLPKILIAILILGAFVPDFVYAGVGDVAGAVAKAVLPGAVTYFGGASQSMVNTVLAYISYAILQFSAWIVAIAATFLNLGVNMTTHVKDLYDSTEGLGAVWIVVRDLTSMFIIFGLMYFSILTIIGKGGKRVNEFIVAIFIAGVLINFSLFFTRVAVDASNLISLHIYNAISPNSSENLTAGKAFQEGGIANVFMNSLKLPLIYNNTNVLKSADISLSIVIATIAGSAMMFIAAFSFIAAALAFIFRTAILLFCMALSPLYFAAMVFPQLKKRGEQLFDLFTGQLIFMPAYLFLTYIALKFITDPMFLQAFNTATTGAADSQPFGAVTIGVAIQYIVAIVFINIPLAVAVSLGGPSAAWANTLTNKLKGVVGRNTVGRASKFAGEKFDSMAASDFAQKTAFGKGATTVLRQLRISQAVRGQIEKGEKGKYSSSYNLSDLKEEDKKRNKEVAAVRRSDDYHAATAAFFTTPYDPAAKDLSKFKKDTVGKMDVKELQEFDYDKLKEPIFAASIPQSKFDGMLKEMTPTQQDELKAARKEGFMQILKKHDADYLLTTHLSGKAPDIAKLPTNILEEADVAKRLNGDALKKIHEEGVEQKVKDSIRNEIESELLAHARAGTTPPKSLESARKYFRSAAGGIF